MQNSRIVVALGGNALQSSKNEQTAQAQLKVVKNTCEILSGLIESGRSIVIVHGNGPQVGRIVLASEAAKDVTPIMPFDVCGAMSQGYIGYHIQQSLKMALKEKNIDKGVVTLVTQVIVDVNDTAFDNPTKPIGPFYSKSQAEKIAREKGYTMREDAGRGFRRVVASPIPEEIVELESIRQLMNSDVVITCGGGGIPVVRNESGHIEGVAAVIDKDYAAELLAENIDADVLLILTEVEKVAVNFGRPDQIDLESMTYAEAEKYCTEGQFAPGSMLPKVKAAMKFVSANPDRKAIITSLSKAEDALDGRTGTAIIYDS